jgi:hypothetical protein
MTWTAGAGVAWPVLCCVSASKEQWGVQRYIVVNNFLYWFPAASGGVGELADLLVSDLNHNDSTSRTVC